MTNTPLRVLLADDHDVVREGLASLLRRREAEFLVVAEVSDGREAVRQWRALRPDIGILDLRMPVLDGVSTIREIMAAEPEARLIILTTYDTDEDIYQGLRAGAKGYLLKDADRDTILDAVRTVARGRPYIPSVVAARLANRVLGIELTEREREILRLIAEGHSNREIGTRISLSEGTVKSYTNAIYGKLGVNSRAAAIREASIRGLIHIL